MRLAAVFPTCEIGADAGAVRAWATAVEEMGFDRIIAYDHVLGATHERREPPLLGPYTERDPFREPMVLFGFLAAITSRVELMTGVIILPQRHIDTTGRTPFPRDGRLRIADGLWVIGDSAGPELHTHQAHYQGGMAVRMALGEDVTPDYRTLPRATYTDPEAAFVGHSLESAREAGLDAFELVADYATSTKGYAIEAKYGHLTIVVDRGSRQLVGAAIACPDASAAIHECVLAIRANVPIDVLAETIHAFPSTSRSLDGLFADALKALASGT